MTRPSAHTETFSARVIDWWQRQGRRDLPWQGVRDPYRVWLSEIMLQQTQVATVQAFYERFLQRFPDVWALADASEDDVLGLWSGLGYYSRARNLHRCAREVVARHAGCFPSTAAELQRLPGIGRSTAAAIAAFCFGQRSAILDGNVKRVLARVFAMDEDLARSVPQRMLWQRAEDLLPTRQLNERMPAYTQGLMDLGATVCLPRRPACSRCPLADRCQAFAGGQPERYPVRPPRPARKSIELWLLQASGPSGKIWLTQRPARGIWARLHCLPAFESRAALFEAVPALLREVVVEHAPFIHVLTHRDLHIHRVAVAVPTWAAEDWVLEGAGAWFDAGSWPALGLPSPVRRILAESD